MFKITNKTIYCTQGDTGTITFNIIKPDTTAYTFVDGDKIYFRIFDKNDYTSVLLQKQVTCTAGSTSCDMAFSSIDTNFTDRSEEHTSELQSPDQNVCR